MYYNLAGTVDSLIRKDMLESILILNIAVVKLGSTPRFDFNAVTAGCCLQLNHSASSIKIK